MLHETIARIVNGDDKIALLLCKLIGILSADRKVNELV